MPADDRIGTSAGPVAHPAPRATPAAARPYGVLLRRYFLPQWPAAVGLLLLLLALTADRLAQPLLLARFLDDAAARAPLARLSGIGGWFLALAAAGQVMAVAERYAGEAVAQTATNRLRADMLLHCLRLDLGFHDAHRPGELVQRIDGDTGTLANFFSRFLVTLVAEGLLLGGIVAAVGTVAWWLGCAVAAFAALVLLALHRLRAAAQPAWARFLQAQADQAGFLEEHLTGAEDIRTLGAAPFALRRFRQQAAGFVRRRVSAAVLGDGAFAGAGAFLFALGTAAVLALAAWQFRRNAMPIGTVFLLFAYMQMLAGPIQAIQRQVRDLQTAGAAMDRIHGLLQTPGELAEPARPVPLPAGPLRVEVGGVTAAYAAGAAPALQAVSLRLEPGRVLGLVGATGSGKTTLARLLLRFRDPSAGVVRIGEVDLRAAALGDLRRRVGLVSQEVQLLRGSARDNVTLFDPDVPDARVAEILRQLGLGAWLEGLPDGLDTVVGSAGAGLSAGEAQLLAFARVFLRDPGLVILDEATARLDGASEERLEAAVARLLRGRTAVVIAHRLRTVRHADEILVLDRGRVAEHGERRALEANPASRYAALLRLGAEEGPA